MRILASLGRMLLIGCLALLAPCAWSQSPPLTTLHAFQGTSPGQTPAAGLAQGADGNFYGTTANGGANGNGVVFKITPQGVLTDLYSFSATSANTDGTQPTTLVAGSDGNFYGITILGGAYSAGTVFKITPGGALTTLHAFADSDGYHPDALVQGRDGNFYGTNEYGGANETGTVFKITPAGGFTLLHSFSAINGASGNGDGAYPNAVLIQGSDGNFYGVTFRGGPNDAGTVYQITPGGTLTNLHAFNGLDGSHPTALAQGSDGNFYGITSYGGQYDNGVIFRLTPGGALTVMTSISPAGTFSAEDVTATLIAGSDGNLYGTVYGNSAYPNGAVFQLTLSGDFTVLHGSSNPSLYGHYAAHRDGQQPMKLTQGSAGNLSVTTYGGGRHTNSTVYKLTAAGALTTLYSFPNVIGPDGATPKSAPIQGSDGSFYGVSSTGGPYGEGTVYKVSPTGAL